jgi:glucose/arabinose dehydrogenase
MKKTIQLMALSLVLLLNAAKAQITLSTFQGSLSEVVDIRHCGDDRMFVVQKTGLIRIVVNGGILATPFINLSSLAAPGGSTGGNERGLLGLAFHPDYANNGYFYVNYTAATDGYATHVSRFNVSAANPNVADPASEVVLMDIPQPFSNHNGGCIQFGPDGYLYIGMGDGGSANDPQGTGQNLTSWLGKMLRIDVNNSTPPLNYSIPADNPYATSTTNKKEIWTYGWRNPWRFSFDRMIGDMWIGDVGQNAWEEIDFEAAGGLGGLNYGWRCYEGLVQSAASQTGCPAFNTTTPPVAVYNHSGNCSVTGGYIYRGALHADLWGKYLYADYCSGKMWSTKRNSNGTFTTVLEGTFDTYTFTTLGEDQYGEMYIGGGTSPGIVYKINGASCNPVAMIDAPSDSVTINAGSSIDFSTPYNPALLYQWQLNGVDIAGADSNVFTASQPGNYTVIVSTQAGAACVSTSSPVNVDVLNSMEELVAKTFSVRPNPSAGVFQLQLNNSNQSIESVSVLNLIGQEVFSKNFSAEATVNATTIDLSGLSNGQYFLRVNQNGSALFSQIILQK